MPTCSSFEPCKNKLSASTASAFPSLQPFRKKLVSNKQMLQSLNVCSPWQDGQTLEVSDQFHDKTPPQLISLLLGLQDIHASADVIDVKQLDHVMAGMQTLQRQRSDLCNVMQTQPHVLWDLQVGTHTQLKPIQQLPCHFMHIKAWRQLRTEKRQKAVATSCNATVWHHAGTCLCLGKGTSSTVHR